MEHNPLVAVNLHITRKCNAKCRYCFAHFYNSQEDLDLKSWLRIIELLANEGCRKINFAGGEPTLRPDLPLMIHWAKSHGMTTSVISNGYKAETLILESHESLDWLGFSLDSVCDETSIHLGRASKVGLKHKIQELLILAKGFGIRTKLNTVVTALNYQETMVDFVKQTQVDRWKVFQMLLLKGENENVACHLEVTKEQFEDYIQRNECNVLVAEQNDHMIDSYAMINPQGCFFGNSNGEAFKSSSILNVGVRESLQQSGYAYHKLKNRGGLYTWATSDEATTTKAMNADSGYSQGMR